jgi:hypothetical protein
MNTVINIKRATSDDAQEVAVMVGELQTEIVDTIRGKGPGFGILLLTGVRGRAFLILIMIGSWGPGHLLASHRLGLARWHTPHGSRVRPHESRVKSHDKGST